jgi:hypothetical protein
LSTLVVAASAPQTLAPIAAAFVKFRAHRRAAVLFRLLDDIAAPELRCGERKLVDPLFLSISPSCLRISSPEFRRAALPPH